MFHVEHRANVSRGTMRESPEVQDSRGHSGSDQRVGGLDLSCTYQKEPPQGVGHWDGLAPLPSVDSLNFREVPGADPKDNLFRSNLF